jgi:hypothetical protein
LTSPRNHSNIARLTGTLRLAVPPGSSANTSPTGGSKLLWGEMSLRQMLPMPRSIFVGWTLPIFAGILLAQTSITTHHYDNYRTGWNQTETVLTPANVWSPNFGLLHTVTLDDQVDAQPLVMPGISITAGSYPGKHDLVYVATENNTVYAIDADSGALLLSANLGHPVPRTELPGQCGLNGPNVGINSTPVIDAANNAIYVIAYTNDGPTYRLHALDLSSLKDKSTPEIVSGSQVLWPSGTFHFNAKYQRQRAALLLANGNIYAGFASFCDQSPNLSRGWLMGWNATTLQPLPPGELLDSQESDKGSYFLSSIWMSGSGPAADSAGNILVVTGNSDNQADTYDGVTDLQESVVKLNPALDQVMDIFTPSNQWDLDQIDGDFGSGGVLIVPPQPGSTTRLAVAAGKDGQMYLMNEDHLGGHSPTANDVLGTYTAGPCWCAESYYVDPSDGLGRIVSSAGNWNQLQIWRLRDGPSVALQRVSNASLGPSLQDPGFFTTISSSGTAHPIIWAISRPQSKTSPRVNLWAFDPESGGTIPTKLLDLPAGAWPNLGGNANLVPVVANGHVYAASHGQLQIFGLASNHVRVEAKTSSAITKPCSSSAQSAWSSPSSSSSPGANFASAALVVTSDATTNSQCLSATGFKFAIPATATILGIEVSAIAYQSTNNVPVKFTAQLLSNGIAIGTPQSFSVTNSLSRYTVGAWNNLWGTSLTGAQINGTGFGASMQAKIGASTPAAAKAFVDDVQITVFYAP